jgi:hypothetical protein
MCIGGNSAKTDRKQQLNAYNDLNTTYDTLSKTGAAFTGAGAGDLGKASKYYSDVLSGDPNKVVSATAPQANILRTQANQQKKEISNFGNRGGGTNSTTQNINSNARGQLADETLKARSGAAAGVEGIGATEVGTGVGATTGAGQVGSALLSGSTAARGQSQKIHDQAIQNWANLVGDALTGQGALTALQSWGG